MEPDFDRDRFYEADQNRDGDRGRDGDRTREADRRENSDGSDERPFDRYRGGSRIVRGGVEREYDVASEDRPGRRRRIIVIERGAGRINRDAERFEPVEGPEDFFFGGGGFPFRF